MKHFWLLMLIAIPSSSQAQTASQEELTHLWATSIRDRIYSNWTPPSSGSFSSLGPCKVEIRILPNGQIFSVLVKPPCSTIPHLRDALERAVVKSDPLPIPLEPSVFVSLITFTFKD